MAMMAEKKDKVQEILKVVRSTRVIDTTDVNRMVELQDLFNVNALQVQQVMEQLDREGRRRLLWIVTTAAGYDTFEFWLQHGIYAPWAQARIEELEKSYEEAYKVRFQEVEDGLVKVLNRQCELDKREADLCYREGLATLRAEKQAGEKVRVLRQQVERLQKELETERALNQKAKRLARLVEKL